MPILDFSPSPAPDVVSKFTCDQVQQQIKVHQKELAAMHAILRAKRARLDVESPQLRLPIDGEEVPHAEML